MHPLGLLLTTIFCGVVLSSSRHAAALAVIGATFYLTQGQAIYFAGFNFTAIRIVLLVGAVRVMMRGELRMVETSAIDKSLLIYVFSTLTIFTYRVGTMSGFYYEVGSVYNILLSYFVFRALLPTLDDLKAILPTLAVLIVPFAATMLLEAITGRDVFAVFGGVDEFAWARGEHFRARSSFRSPITAGATGAALAPLFLSRYLAGEKRRMGIGVAACVAIVLASHSSGPLMGFLAGILGLLLWRIREDMRRFRRIMFAALIFLHLVMNAPVWFLIARVGTLVGGDAWYRAALIDAFVNRFREWWLLGTDYTADWMPTQLNGGADITNVLVGAGVEAGIAAVILFVLLIVKCFQKLGIARQLASESSLEDEWLLWGLGACLFSHLINQTSVTYFDQTHVLWYMSLAIIAGATVTYRPSGTSLEVASTASPADGTDLAFST